MKHTCYSGILCSIMMNFYLPGADPRSDKNACMWAQRTNTAPSRTQGYPIFFHMFFPLDSVHAQGLWLLHPCWDFSHSQGTKMWASCHYLWAAHISQLSEACSSLLTPSAAMWYGRTGRVTSTTQNTVIWAMNCVLLPFPIFCGLCFHKEVWKGAWDTYMMASVGTCCFS